METLLGFLGGLLIALVPYVWKKYISRPELTIEIIKDGGSSAPKGLSHKNVVNEEGYIDSHTAIRVFELTWRFQIKITNNSELTAFYPELTFNPNGPKFNLMDKLNSLQPIKPTETIVLKAEYRIFEEKTGQERTDIGRQMPEEFEQLGLLLTYQSPQKTIFHTLFAFNEKTNKFIKRKPNVYKNN
ncbi:hypothetical protein I5M32_16250 [Pedobacter sp. SD-b]|uniref:DUF4178 domain-containing protein n=1 Tax=Pedobacter segetis TaxID=2793069 RepID=A0ABS1BQ12_9SPHI|nr:hypothetical protein [Pedobacter segetis]MBK0384519.1 hypothetical protein [Pedobacter segetis]